VANYIRKGGKGAKVQVYQTVIKVTLGLRLGREVNGNTRFVLDEKTGDEEPDGGGMPEC